MISQKIFLAGPFKSLIQASTGLMEEYQLQRILRIIKFFEERGYSIHNAHQREAWGKELMTPEECTQIDFEQIRLCDYFIAFPGSPASPGAHIEIGWASALNKPIILLLEKEKNYAFLVQGLHTVARVTSLYFAQESDYLEKFAQMFPEVRQKNIEEV